jgi:hypothetical protein
LEVFDNGVLAGEAAVAPNVFTTGWKAARFSGCWRGDLAGKGNPTGRPKHW